MFWLIGAAFEAGVGGSSLFAADLRIAGWLAATLLISVLIIRYSWQRYILVAAAFFLLGLAYMQWRYPLREPLSASAATVTGEVSQANDSATVTHLTLENFSLNGRREEGQLAVVTAKGDYEGVVTLRGAVKPLPRTLQNPALRGEMAFPVLLEERKVRRSPWDAARIWLVGRIQMVTPAPESDFLAGLLVGARQSLSPDLRQRLNRTGTSHIIAVSGYNLSIIVVVLLALRGWLPYRALLLGSLGFVVSFTLVTGASASVVRAAIMAGIVLTARLLFLWTDTGRLLLIAAVAMTLWNPQILLGDVGFELSFLATAGIVWIEPRLSVLLGWLPTGLRELISVTLAAQLATDPLILIVFGRISLVALPLNMLILPMIPLAMLLGFMAILCELVLPMASPAVGLTTWSVLHLILTLIQLAGSAPFSSVVLSGRWLWVAAATSTVVCAALLCIKPRKESYELV